MFSSSFPNRTKQQDEIPIVENESLEDAVFALENSQVEGCYFEGMQLCYFSGSCRFLNT